MLMMKQLILALGVSLSLLAPLKVLAEDNPENIVQGVSKTTSEQSFESGDTGKNGVNGSWVQFVRKQPFSKGSYNGGVKQFEDRDIIVASGVAIVNVREGQPGWIESRIAAYDRAELEAKAQLAKFLISDIDQERSAELVENAQTNDGEVQRVEEGSELIKKIKRIGDKGLKIIEAEMDNYLAKYDGNYNSDDFTPIQKKIRVQEVFKRVIGNSVIQMLNGYSPSYTTEAHQNNEYAVLVGIVWSPKSSQLAVSMANDVYNIPEVAPSKSINQFVSDLGPKVLNLWGTRLLIDEKGHYNVVAFAQAAPAKTSPSRQESAILRAKKVANNRANAMIATFVKESISASESENFSEDFQEFDDGTQGAEIVRKFIERRKGKSKNVKLRGLSTITEWSIDHPVTGQKIAGAVVVWSPSSRAMAENMLRKMKQKPTIDQRDNEPKAMQPNQQEEGLEPVVIDTSVY